MPKSLPPIHESQEELLSLVHTLADRERKTRVHALFLANMGYCTTRTAIAQALCVERKAVERWFTQYATNGLQALLVSQRRQCGKKAHIRGEALTQLQAQLARPEGFHGYRSICTWLAERFQLDVSYKTVHHTVHTKLHAAPKVPRKSNCKQDAAAVTTFKKTTLRSN
jgi:transposase